MNKRILIFSTAYFPLVGGAEVAIKQITDRLGDFDFDLITARLNAQLPPVETIGRVTVYRLGGGSTWDKIRLAFASGRLAKKLNQQNSYSAVWAMMASYGGFGALFFKLFHPQIPFLLTLQEGDDLQEIEKKVFLIRPLFKMIFTRADVIQSISTYLAVWARKMGARCPIEVVPNGVDLKKFSLPGIEKVGAEKILITTSRLVKKNAVSDIISALPSLSTEIKLWIVGIGNEEQRLRELVKALKLSDRVIFKGFVDNEKLPLLLAEADIFIRPSLSEGLGNSFLEAMAASLPVIATPVGGIPDFLIDGETGWFVGVKKPIEIAEKVKMILDPSQKALVAEVVAKARAMVEEKYNWQTISMQMGRIFDRLTGK